MKKPSDPWDCRRYVARIVPVPTMGRRAERSFGLSAVASTIFALFCGLATTWAEPGTKPVRNVLFIIADDLNCDLGCYGSEIARSPNIDKLAAKGMRFERAYVQYTVCNPSRTSFLTGLRPETTGVTMNETPFRMAIPDVVTLPQCFREQGYESFGLGKVFHRGLNPDESRPERDDRESWTSTFYGKATDIGNRGQGRNMSGGRLPWCRWMAADGGDEDQADGQTTSEAIRLMSNANHQPFFLAIGYYRPHDPFQSPARFFELHPLSGLDPPREPETRSPYLMHAIPRTPKGGLFDSFTAQDKREFLRAYHAGVSFMDSQVGRLMDALDRLDLWESTVVVFVGDHGYELGVRNWWNKNTLFERSCRTPLLVWAPGAKGMGQPCFSIVEFVDLFPTLVDLFGLKAPPNIEGESFRQQLDDPNRPFKSAAYTMVKRGPAVTGRSVRTKRYRYTEWNDGKDGAELYDHDSDSGEWINRAEDPSLSAIVEEHRSLLRKR